jgi:hypothetical protein
MTYAQERKNYGEEQTPQTSARFGMINLCMIRLKQSSKISAITTHIRKSINTHIDL